MTTEQLIRTYYAAWETKEWSIIDSMLSDDFTFTSANDDDHIGKSVFETKCWHEQVNFIRRFDLECVLTDDANGFVRYLCHTTQGPSFRNVEHFRFVKGKIGAIECYFGERVGFPSAAATEKS